MARDQNKAWRLTRPFSPLTRHDLADLTLSLEVPEQGPCGNSRLERRTGRARYLPLGHDPALERSALRALAAAPRRALPAASRRPPVGHLAGFRLAGHSAVLDGPHQVPRPPPHPRGAPRSRAEPAHLRPRPADRQPRRVLSFRRRLKPALGAIRPHSLPSAISLGRHGHRAAQ